MTKYRINYNTVEHGTISWHHKGKDSQYCEAGEPVKLAWQPSSGWGLAEAHYTDGDGNVTAIDIKSRTFTMPASDITISGTFKRFVLEDWTSDKEASSGPVVSLGAFDASELPQLTGDEAVGTMAFVKGKNKYAVWNGNYWTFMDGTPVVPQWLKFTANVDGSSVGFCCWSEDYEPVDMGKNMQYSIDGGETWQDYTIGLGAENVVAINIDEGESVLFRGVNENLAYYLENEDDYIFTKCVITGSIAASGDITSLLNGAGGDVSLPVYCYANMFKGCTGLTSAPSLPATTLANSCYGNMFKGCTGLTSAPSLPATTLANRCYGNMFSGCTGLTSAPSLPATTLANSCYGIMFKGCTGLTSAPSLPATTLANNCYANMFEGCTGLTSAPAMPATTLANSCYANMFQGCTGLTSAPALPATTLANNCYNGMFQGCTHITSHHATTMNNSTNVFANNSACETFTIDDATPPTIGNNTITGLKAGCIIYVPAGSVDAYKAKQYWSARASYIQAKP